MCTVYLLLKDPTYGIVGFTRMVAVNSDGSGLQVLSKRESSRSRGVAFRGGEVLDWLPGDNGAALMTRAYLADNSLGTRLGSAQAGLGVDRVDTRTLASKTVERPHPDAVQYLTDGRGVVRIMAVRNNSKEYVESGVLTFLYRASNNDEWKTLGNYDYMEHVGFLPLAVDPDLNVAYGFRKKDGREALYALALDGSMHAELVYAHPSVDLDELIRIGRRQHVVGVSYVTDKPEVAYFNPEIARLRTALAKALPQQPLLQIVDASEDENRLLIFAGSDSDPGVYYIFDRKSRQLQTFLVARPPLEGVKLASVRPVSYPGPDGVAIPGYLTLPPGVDSPSHLPAIVMPHGGPNARDTWGFDWLAQFYAARGFVVLQPNFRGSTGYGDDWFEKNGFRSWPVAIGDILAGGRWFAAQGIADPAKLAVVGWSYGGYAALQSAVIDPSVFKAVVAIAPVTDLNALKEQSRRWSNYELVSRFVGEGPHTHEGSPLKRADRIQAPVLMFHGTLDRNVSIEQSRRMDERLRALGARSELVSCEGLDHYLEDSDARANMLRRSESFLRRSLGL